MNQTIITLGSFQQSGQAHIFELAAIQVLNDRLDILNFHEYLNPSIELPDEIKNGFGLSDIFLADKRTFQDVKFDFLNFTNASSNFIFQNRKSMEIFEQAIKSNWNLGLSDCFEKISFFSDLINLPIAEEGVSEIDIACDYFQIDRSMKTSPSALLDAEFMAEIYMNKIN